MWSTALRSLCPGLALAAALVAASSARAAVLSEDEFAGKSTELGVVGRSFLFLLFGESLEPPVAPADVSPTGSGIADLRLYFTHTTPTLKVVLHHQLLASVSAHDSGVGFAIGRGVAPSRWLPLRADKRDPTVLLSSTVDWAYVAYTRERLTVTAGRQPVTFGRAKIWKPIDLVATFALTEVDTEYKPGADAVRLDWSPTSQASLTLVAAAGELAEEDGDLEATPEGSVALARYKQGGERGELGGIAGFVRGDAVAGIDGVFDTGAFEIYGEGTLTLVTGESVDSPEAGAGDVVPKGALGATFRPSDSVTAGPEILYNGFGAGDPDDYAAVALSDRVAVGEQITFGRLYAGGVADWQVHPLVHFGGAALVNLLDPSALVSAALRYEIAPNTEAYLGGYLPVGRAPETSTTFEDEFGVYPYFFFFELKAIL